MQRQLLTSLGILALSFSFGCSSSDFVASGEARPSTKKHSAATPQDDGNDGDHGGDSDGLDDANDSSGGDASDSNDSAGGTDSDTRDDGEEGDDSQDGDKKDDDVKIDEGSANVCDNPNGEVRQKISIGGEDVPGNGLAGGPDAGSPLGSDFDDYKLEFAGNLTREGLLPTAGRIGMKKKGNVAINYSRGTTACSHDFEIVVRRCPNKDAKELARHRLTIGTNNNGTTSFKVTHDNVYLDIVMTVSGSSRRDFGGCSLPFPLTNKLYGNTMPGFIL